ncbi:MAG: M48 family metalloprotease [Rhodobacteraceae bacterium]|nr:M48 family metalloprotease [Paracoccaceae bacterium]
MSLFRLLQALALIVVVALPAPARAVGLLRDAGMEHGLNQLARPIIAAAGLSPSRIQILVINDMSLNAFVTNGRAVFIHAGLILRLQSSEALQAVIAHEVAHIANGHYVRRSINAQNAQRNSLFGLAAGVAAGVASGNPALGAGIAQGTAGSALGVFLSHTRAEEAAADKSGLRYMARAGIPPEAMAEVFDLFAGQEALAPERQSAWARTHPVSRERARAAENFAAVLSPRTSDRTETEYWYQRARGKLSAYLRSPSYTLDRVGLSDMSDPARIQRAMAYFKMPDMSKARTEVAGLIEARPDDPYFHELLGWMEIESGNAERAIDAYREAVALAPRAPMILAGYGRSLLALNTPATDAEALTALETARSRDRNNQRLLRDLAVAYARTGNNGMASLSTAQRYEAMGRREDARLHAARAVDQLPVGSPGWSRAQDIMRATEPNRTRR